MTTFDLNYSVMFIVSDLRHSPQSSKGFSSIFHGSSFFQSSLVSQYGGGITFKGRGIIQLTHDYTYLAYYDYKNSTNFYKNVTIHHKKFTKIDITHCLRKFKCDRILSGGKNDRFRNN